MYQHTKDILSGLAFLAIALVFQSQTADLTGVTVFFPEALIIFLVAGSIFLILKGIINRKSQVKDDEVVAVGRVILISVISIAYALLVPLLGFFVASIVFLFFSAVVFREADKTLAQSLVIAAGFTGVFCLFVWLVFVMLLNVPTPEGLFF